MCPQSLNLGFIVLSFLFGGAVIYWQWEAMVTSYLSARVTTLPFDDLPGLVDKTDFKIAVTPGSSFIETFRSSGDDTWRKAYKTRIEPYVDKYQGHGDNMIQFPLTDKKTALYDNYYATRY